MKRTHAIVAVSVVVLVVGGVGIYYASLKNNSQVTSNIPESTTRSLTTSPPVFGSSTPASPTVANVTVNIKNFSFDPAELVVKVGTVVTWVNNDAVLHTVTSDSGGVLNSPVLSHGQSFTFAVTNSGTLRYHCSIHPMMKGSVVVQK
ncbi:MAG: cupredoxin domain-containing protein [Minisyncoccota bacterium]